MQVSVGVGEKAKMSEELKETVEKPGDSTHPWTPKARLQELYYKQIAVTVQPKENTIFKMSFKKLSIERIGCSVPIRVDLISASAVTEYIICPNIETRMTAKLKDDNAEDETNDIPSDIGRFVPVMLAASYSEKWKGETRRAGSRNKHASSNENVVDCFATPPTSPSNGQGPDVIKLKSSTKTDFEDRSWTLQPDLHSAFLRFTITFDDICRIPENHLRYVIYQHTWLVL